MKYTSGPSDSELHARLNAFLQADAESETADEDTICDEVQQLTEHLPAKASDEPAHAGRRSADRRQMTTSNRVRWGSSRSILEAILLVIVGSSLAVSLMAARATTLASVVADAVATATVLALVYVRTASHGWTTSQARADLLIRLWEREDRREALMLERQDRELAYAREDRREALMLERQDRELAYAREALMLEREDRERAYAREDALRHVTWEHEDRVRERERQDRLRHEELANTREMLSVRQGVLKQLVERGHLDSVNIDELVRSLTTPADDGPSSPADDGPFTIQIPSGLPARAADHVPENDHPPYTVREEDLGA